MDVRITVCVHTDVAWGWARDMDVVIDLSMNMGMAMDEHAPRRGRGP